MSDQTLELIELLGSCASDPLKFVETMFEWGVPGSPLEYRDGPVPWQRELLESIRDGMKTPAQAIQEATVSGNGVGKTTVVSWIIIWAASTRRTPVELSPPTLRDS